MNEGKNEIKNERSYTCISGIPEIFPEFQKPSWTRILFRNSLRFFFFTDSTGDGRGLAPPPRHTRDTHDLNHWVHKFPEIRVCLSGIASRGLLLKGVGSVHMVLIALFYHSSITVIDWSLTGYCVLVEYWLESVWPLVEYCLRIGWWVLS